MKQFIGHLLSVAIGVAGAVGPTFGGEMPESTSRGRELVQRLEETFPRKKLPTRLAIRGDHASKGIEHSFKNYQLGLIGDQVFFDQRMALAVLTPQAFKALLPRYLEYMAKNPASDVTERVAHFLLFSPPEAPGFVTSRLSKFDREQLECIGYVLEQIATILAEPEPVLSDVVSRARATVSECVSAGCQQPNPRPSLER